MARWSTASGRNTDTPKVSTARVFPTERRDPNERIDERLDLAEIAGALAQLTDEQREVVMSRLILGLTLEETSRRMRKNVGAIKALQHRALARLAKSLLAGDADNA